MRTEVTTFRQAKITPTDESIRRTVRIIHERFGGDMAAFLKHAREKREQRAKDESVSQDIETVSCEQ